MLKIAAGLICALLLASCAYTPAPAPAPGPVASSGGGVGHPDDSYPGPRVY
jgi:hypothetical protein